MSIAGANLERPSIGGNLLHISAGATFEGLDIRGNLTVSKADNVSLRNVRIEGYLKVIDSAGFSADNVEILGQGNGAQALVWFANSPKFMLSRATIRPTVAKNQNGIQTDSPGIISACDISNVVDGVQISSISAVSVSVCKIHSLVSFPMADGKPTHGDGIQIQQGTGHRITGNVLEGGNNTCIQITQDSGPLGDLLVTSNSLRGGATCINFKTNTGKGAYGQPIKVVGNSFAKGSTTGGLKNGGAIIANLTFTGLVVGQNFWDDGNPVVVDKGA